MLWANGIQQIRIHGIVVLYIYNTYKKFRIFIFDIAGHLQRCRQARDALSSLLGYIYNVSVRLNRISVPI
eukprot:jgi/Picre1/30192/NNA_005561.t1